MIHRLALSGPLALFFLLFIFIAALFESPALAGICVPPSAKQEPYNYLLALVDGMSYAKTGLDRFDETSAPSKANDAAFNLLYAFRLAKADFECAASQVTPYSEDPREPIKMSAQGASLSFLTLAQLMDEQRVYYR